jgi:hypothetical protein
MTVVGNIEVMSDKFNTQLNLYLSSICSKTIIKLNSVQLILYLFTCLLKSPKANYKISTSKRICKKENNANNNKLNNIKTIIMEFVIYLQFQAIEI